MIQLRTISILAAALVGSPPITAQVTATLVAVTGGVSAQGGSSTQILPGTDLSAGLSLTATYPPGMGTARLDLRPLILTPGEALFECHANTFGGLGATDSQLVAVLTLSLPTPGPVRIEVEGRASRSAQGFASFLVDLDDDSVNEAGPVTGTWAFARTIGPTGLQVRLQTMASTSFYHGQGIADLVLRVVPDTGCTGTEVLPACNASTLAVEETFGGGIVFTAGNLLPTAHAALIVGLQPASIPLPPECTLGVDTSAVLWLPPTGPRRQLGFALPPALRPLTAWFQVLQIENTGSIGASAVVRLDCP